MFTSTALAGMLRIRRRWIWASNISLGNPRATCSSTDSRPYLASSCGQLVHIECRAWYDGVEHRTKDKAGLVQFDVHLQPTGDQDSTPWGRRAAEEVEVLEDLEGSGEEEE